MSTPIPGLYPQRTGSPIAVCCLLVLLGGCLEEASPSDAGTTVRDGSSATVVMDARVAAADAGATSDVVAPSPDPALTFQRPPPCEVRDAGPADAAPDAQVELDAGKGPLTVLVVFDKSTSMDLAWDHRSRWDAASDAMLAAMRPLAKRLTVGGLLFPTLGSCHVAPHAHERQIPFVPGKEFIAAWQAQVCWSHEPWGTPLGLALQEADVAIAQAARDGRLEGRFRVMIVTDGEPNCGATPEEMRDIVSGWTELGVETFVLGLPGSAPAADLLDALAEAGGTGVHQSPGTPEEFQEQTTILLL